MIYAYVDIDECLTNQAQCAAEARCSNTDGSYKCTCNIGYTGDGHTCMGKSALSRLESYSVVCPIQLITLDRI